MGISAMTCFFTMQLNWLSLLQVEPQIFSGKVIQKKSTSKNSIQILLQIHALDEQSLWPKPTQLSTGKMMTRATSS